eukprot:TRINITY_DN1184_c2_g1_i2.p1 TRINITY_DN1184_c2_g1~~TRINITY_DN1184_c2_g1_i2.p1  ORF type:complete len:265 (-),score=91.86 TRINITY_DN1184_c2_g1_i2:261-1055(-)
MQIRKRAPQQKPLPPPLSSTASRFAVPQPPSSRQQPHPPVVPSPPSSSSTSPSEGPTADGETGWSGRKRRRAEMEKGFRPKFYPKDEHYPELDAMLDEATREVKKQKVVHNHKVIYTVIVNYLNEFWRHEVELRAPSRYLSTVTGYANSPERQWWDDDNGDVAATTTHRAGPGNRPQQQQQQQSHHNTTASNSTNNNNNNNTQQQTSKTRWQEVAEGFFTQCLKLSEEFDWENPRHLRAIVNMSKDHTKDPTTRRIAANYLGTL